MFISRNVGNYKEFRKLNVKYILSLIIALLYVNVGKNHTKKRCRIVFSGTAFIDWHIRAFSLSFSVCAKGSRRLKTTVPRNHRAGHRAL